MHELMVAVGIVLLDQSWNERHLRQILDALLNDMAVKRVSRKH